MPLQHFEGCGLGAARGLAYIAHVVDMKVDEFAEGLQTRCTGLGRRLDRLDARHRSPSVVSAQERLAGVATFATHLDTPGAGREFCVGGHFSCALRVQ